MLASLWEAIAINVSVGLVFAGLIVTCLSRL